MRAKVLVVEDDSEIRELVRDLLIGVGYAVQVSRNGVDALDRITKTRPQGIILDINMPEMDGFEVLEAMKAVAPRTPTLVLTARHNADDVKRAVRLGAKDYLTKPFSAAQLTARVERLLRAPIPPPVAHLDI